MIFFNEFFSWTKCLIILSKFPDITLKFGFDSQNTKMFFFCFGICKILDIYLNIPRTFIFYVHYNTSFSSHTK